MPKLSEIIGGIIVMFSPIILFQMLEVMLWP
jgi:hypothetical protein